LPQPAKGAGRREALRACRKKADKTLGDLAQALDVSVVYVSDVERGNRPPFRPDLIDTADAFLGANAAELHKLASEVPGAFELRTNGMPERAREFVAGLARGYQYPGPRRRRRCSPRWPA
jgi:transcriptional regulator with XRE-family HTH domain